VIRYVIGQSMSSPSYKQTTKVSLRENI
jgi:hypothetical protein